MSRPDAAGAGRCPAIHDRLGPAGSIGPTFRFVCEVSPVGSVIKKRRKRMAKKKHRKLLKRTRVQRRNAK